MQVKTSLKIALAAAGLMAGAQAMADITFYERENFNGQSFTAERQVRNFERYGFNDRASSLTVGQDRWEVCENPGFQGHCVIVRPGNYPSLRAIGLNNRISSVRMVARDDSEPPVPPVSYNNGGDWRPRDGERLYEADVVAVHAVVGPPERRCWVERQSAVENNGNRAGGAIAGALIGGILGHQVGGGSGRDLATAGGAVAGAVVGSNLAGNSDRVVSQNVERCRVMPSDARPDYWDVTYMFRGQEHRMQMTQPPGSTVTVNRDGEPRMNG
ncbi:beta/gamma crystallin-related protein [Pelomonas sp. KK5]|uniref:beta/gamma crystallin-related protein n=1 Tax=Pelomonas sp. KK5 TaxID=1855730 RepID=UPI00097CBFFC|nr:beta/gamma crystallin-related protein [Pelomonas sp. KK5]